MAAKSGATYDGILKDLKAGNFSKIYLLHGDESFYIDSLVDYFENHVLEESEKAFNLSVFYGRDIEPKQVIDQASRFPMMSERQVVIIKEAQEMKDLRDLANYCARAPESTILVFCYKHKKFDKRTKLAKAIAQHGTVFESKRVYQNKIPGWITQYLKSRKYSIDQKAAILIGEYLGSNLTRIANELNKLILNLEPGPVSSADIEKYIGISKDHNIFELQTALALRDTHKSYRIIRYFIENPKNNPMVVIVSGLFNYFSKIFVLHGLGTGGDREIMSALKLSHTYFVAEYRRAAKAYNRRQCEKVIHILREYDLRSKGVNNDHFTHESLMQEMIYRILAV